MVKTSHFPAPFQIQQNHERIFADRKLRIQLFEHIQHPISAEQLRIPIVPHDQPAAFFPNFLQDLAALPHRQIRISTVLWLILFRKLRELAAYQVGLLIVESVVKRLIIIRRHIVIAVAKAYDVALRILNARDHGRLRPAIFFVNGPNARILFCPGITHFRRMVTASIVYQKKLKVRKRLIDDAFDTLIQVFFCIVYRNDYADFRHITQFL